MRRTASSYAERGALSVNVRLFADHRDIRVINSLANRALLAFVAVALGLISVQLLDGADGPALRPLELLGYIGLVTSVVLILRTLVAILTTDG